LWYNSDKATCWLLAGGWITNLVRREALRTACNRLFWFAKNTVTEVPNVRPTEEMFKKKSVILDGSSEVSFAVLGISASKECGHYFPVIGFQPLLTQGPTLRCR
jgi:hypothetical protein